MTDGTVTDDEKKYRESIAKSMADIIRFSLNEDFRKRCCELFGVFSTKDAETEMNKRLMSMLENKNTCSKKGRKKLSKENNKENEEEQNDILAEKTRDESSNTNTDTSSQTLSQNFFQKNWLQISSQRYREVIKRRRLQFYSQPQFTESSQKNVEFFSCDTQSSVSQPLSEVPSCSQLNTFCELSDDGINFCRKRFKESFEENAGKYLKENFKYHRNSSI